MCVGWGLLQEERETLENEKEQFKEFMEKEKVKLRESEQKFKAEVSEKNKALRERELNIRKNEEKLLKLAEQLAELAEQNSEKESRLRGHYILPYLIFVASISSGASVKKKLLRGIFWTINAKRTPDSVTKK